MKIQAMTPSMPADQSLEAFKTWLISTCQAGGQRICRSTFTEAEWQALCASYWRNNPEGSKITT